MRLEEVIQNINNAITEALPRDFSGLMWNCQILTECEQVYDSNDKTNRVHDKQGNFIVEDDRFDLQLFHLIDKGKASNYEAIQEHSLPTYKFEGVLVGVSNKPNVGRYLNDFIAKVDKVDLVSYSEESTMILQRYWGNNKKLGQNPDKYAFVVNYIIRATNNDRKYFFDMWLSDEQKSNSINYIETCFETNIPT
jgi:hypothetical protein